MSNLSPNKCLAVIPKVVFHKRNTLDQNAILSLHTNINYDKYSYSYFSHVQVSFFDACKC